MLAALESLTVYPDPAGQSLPLPISGAVLSYTSRGTGPLLLLISGGEGGGGGYNNLVDALSERYTVVTFARRTGQATPVYQCTQALAARLNKETVVFPSHHSGHIAYPRAFATQLVEVLQGREQIR